jgi:glycosyltransferase involved in cell wall biosynthesis
MRERVSGGAPYILSVGVIEPRKNLNRLIEAFEILKARHGSPHRLVLAGKRGWLSEGIYRRAASSPFRSDIVFSGFVPESDLPALYSAADILAYPSLYEGFGLPPLEAMACGTPVVVSNSSSLPEVVGEAALMVEPEDTEGLADAMSTLLFDQDIRRRMVEAGLQQASGFTWRAAAERMLAIYRRLGAGVHP